MTQARPRVGLFLTLGLIYPVACGGPYGMENFVAKVGPGMFLALLFLTPWLWGVPTALATAELSARHPITGGYYKWAQLYLGDFWGYQEGMWNILGSLLDNALYPVLFANALTHYAPGITERERWLAAVAFIFVLTYVNYRGIQVTGAVAVGLNVVLIAPLVWMIGAALFSSHLNPFLPFLRPGIDPKGEVGTSLALALWLYSGYSEVSVAAEEIEDPQRNIPRALLILTPIVTLSYALPTIAGLVSEKGWEGWTSGQFASIGDHLGGAALGHWLFLGSVASQTVIFLAYLLFWSRLVWAMAADRHLPGFLSAIHPKYGTPHRILFVYAVLYSVMAALPFDKLLVADSWLSGAAGLVLLSSLVRARYVEDRSFRGFRVSGGKWGVWVCFLVPAVTWVVLVRLTARDNFWSAVALLLGPVLYGLERLFRRFYPSSGTTLPTNRV